ncbi:hypothetical protein C0995_012008 [Termitomyces sp. Mi166|nr:hypothetical protein C0995_012008 [Termitomyces sp. Mi166\
MEARLLPLFNDYASGLAASLGYGAASELLRRTGGASSEGSVFITEVNIKRLMSKLSQMRGAALELGQSLSIQDTHVFPSEVDQIFRRVQDSAHYMPDWQMEKVMTSSLGPDWAKNFQSFERFAFAAASIGQVRAVLAASASPTGRPEPVTVKVLSPNIGLSLDRSVQVLKDELADECDYTREGSFLTKFGSSGYLGGDPRFKVPWVWEGSMKSVLVMERVHGISVGDADINGMSKKDRDDVILDAHVNSMMLLATPFKASTPQSAKGSPGFDLDSGLIRRKMDRIRISLTGKLCSLCPLRAQVVYAWMSLVSVKLL